MLNEVQWEGCGGEMDQPGKKWTSAFLPPGEETDWVKNRPEQF